MYPYPQVMFAGLVVKTKLSIAVTTGGFGIEPTVSPVSGSMI